MHDLAVSFWDDSKMEERIIMMEMAEFERQEKERRLSRREFDPKVIDLDALLAHYTHECAAA
jgi:7,8-dihydro-6-hydroxymethylpterin-pyrophosphokinase